jgi:hypothetical protein
MNPLQHADDTTTSVSISWDSKFRVMLQDKFSPQGWLGVYIELSGNKGEASSNLV